MKRSTGVFPFFYPTTVMFVDDNQQYLSSMGTKLRRRGAYRYFVSPHDALSFLEGQRVASAASGCVSLFADNPNPVGDHVIRLDLRSIVRTLLNPARFAEVSVVVINYDMPGINGLELCRKLAHLPVRKLLFTGSADERLAVEAFNEGVIDGFLSKGTQDVFERLGERIEELQRDYFADLSRFVDEALSYDSMEFLRDPSFAHFFERLREKHGVVEFYVSNEPTGLVLVDEEGAVSLLAVQSKAQLAQTAELALELGVEKPLVGEIRARRAMPVFWWGEGISEGKPRDWERHLHPATPLEGDYYYALVEGVHWQDGAGEPLSFKRFVDTQGRDGESSAG